MPIPFLATLALAAAAPSPASAYRVADTIPIADGRWDLLSVDPVAGQVYVARTDALTAIDLRTRTARQLMPLNHGHAALAIPGTREVLATNGDANTAVIVDGTTGTVRATVPTGKKPDAAVWDPATRTAWVMNADDGTITVIDPVAAKAVATVTVGGALELGQADGQGRLYLNVEDRNEVVVLDTRRRLVVRRFALPGCDGPTGLALAAAARRVVSACANGRAIVSTTDGAPVAALAIGPRPDGAEYDARRGRVLIPSGGDGRLYVIALGPTPRVVQALSTAPGARTIALDPATGRAYLPVADSDPPRAGERYGRQRPGTARVLVVTP